MGLFNHVQKELATTASTPEVAVKNPYDIHPSFSNAMPYKQLDPERYLKTPDTAMLYKYSPDYVPVIRPGGQLAVMTGLEEAQPAVQYGNRKDTAGLISDSSAFYSSGGNGDAQTGTIPDTSGNLPSDPSGGNPVLTPPGSYLPPSNIGAPGTGSGGTTLPGGGNPNTNPAPVGSISPPPGSNTNPPPGSCFGGGGGAIPCQILAGDPNPSLIPYQSVSPISNGELIGRRLLDPHRFERRNTGINSSLTLHPTQAPL